MALRTRSRRVTERDFPIWWINRQGSLFGGILYTHSSRTAVTRDLSCASFYPRSRAIISLNLRMTRIIQRAFIYIYIYTQRVVARETYYCAQSHLPSRPAHTIYAVPTFLCGLRASAAAGR